MIASRALTVQQALWLTHFHNANTLYRQQANTELLHMRSVNHQAVSIGLQQKTNVHCAAGSILQQGKVFEAQEPENHMDFVCEPAKIIDESSDNADV